MVLAASAMLGFLSYWANRHVMYPDGISYIETGAAILRDGWVAAANGCWSPLLPLLTGAALAIFHPAGPGEFRVANGVNFLVYLASVAALEWAIRRYWRRHGESHALSRFEFGLLLHTVNMSAALSVVGMNYFTPDILLMACANLALAAILPGGGIRNAVLLGAALGLGYLGKTAFLVTGGLLWVAAAILWRRDKGAVRGLLIAAAVFIAIAALYFVPVSIQKQRFTIAENGRVNYLIHVLGARNPAAGDPRFGPPSVPVERLAATPATYAIPRWNGVTYSVHYDMSRFYDGWRYSVVPSAHWKAAAKSLRVYLTVFRRQVSVVLLAAALALAALAGLRRGEAWWLLLPVVGSLIVFGLVHVEGPRYTAPLFIPAFFALAANLGAPRTNANNARGWVVIAAAVLCALIVVRAAAGKTLWVDIHPAARMSDALVRAGAKPGDAAATVGRGLDSAWARIGGLWIAAEIPDRGSYAAATQQERDEATAKLRARGVRFLVASGPTIEPGWTKVPDTIWSFRKLD